MSPGRPAASRQRQGGLSHWSGRTGCGPSPARLCARSRRRVRPPWPTMSARKRKTSRRLDLPAALGPTTKRRSPTSNSTFLKFRQLLAARCVILMDGARPSCSMLRRILRRMTVGAAAQDPRAPLRAPQLHGQGRGHSTAGGGGVDPRRAMRVLKPWAEQPSALARSIIPRPSRSRYPANTVVINTTPRIPSIVFAIMGKGSHDADCARMVLQ